MLWQPPYPAGIYSHYKVSIDPADANDSVLYVEKEGEPPGPAQAAFKGLVPGTFKFRKVLERMWNKVFRSSIQHFRANYVGG